MNNKHILIVDDEAILRMALRDRLESVDYRVSSADGGTAAIQMVQEDTFDLIILDLLMPQPNGFAVFKRFKEICVACCTPILILTVVGLEPQIQQMLEQGAHYLQKRAAPEELLSKVQKLISK